jgi:hypothetical protein
MTASKLTLDRRAALKLIASTSAAAASAQVLGENAKRSATDPDLVNPEKPWFGELSAKEMASVAVLADMIIPEDRFSPKATDVNAHFYVDEYVSAPYQKCQEALQTIREGLRWLDEQSVMRFGDAFNEISDSERHMIVEEIKWVASANDRNKPAAIFFALLRDLVATGFYTSFEGMADIGYVGNKPSVSFDGPPREVLIKVGLLDGDIS